MSKSFRVLLLSAFVVISVSAVAQKADLAVTGGVYHPVNNAYASGNAFAIGGNLGIRLASVPFVTVLLELPVMGTLHSTVSSVQALTANGTYSSLFVTPGLRLKLAPSFPISPYVAAGGGWARFNRSASMTPAGESSSVNTNVFDVGGGIDMKVAPFVALRAEVRDFYSGSPQLRPSTIVNTFNERQHNIVGSFGIVLHF